MDTKIAFWGAGAIGGVVGAHLVNKGHPVTFIDVDEAHVRAIKENGVELTGAISPLKVRAKVMMPNEVEETFDLIFLGVKGHHTLAAATALAPHLSRDGMVISLQNGLNAPDIEAAIGPGRTLLCLVNFASDVVAPGTIHYAGRGSVTVGEPDGTMTDRLRQVVSLMQAFDPSIEATPNVLGYLWGKLGYGAVLIATALTENTITEILDSATHAPVLCAIGREMMMAARAAGVDPVGVDGFDAAAFASNDHAAMTASLKAMADHYRGSAKPRTGVWRDLAIRKRSTEVSALFRPVFASAESNGIAMPATRALVQSIGEIETGQRAFSIHNLTTLAA
jgi:2-dehydropantoate 2-reductase